MGSEYVHVPNRNKPSMIRVPSLVDLCVQKAIDNVRYIGNVGETDTHLLERILPHCTVEQLMHIENATTGRDLSSVTNKLWKKLYEAKFGTEAMNKVIENMKRKRQRFPWRQLYQAKLKFQEEAQNKSLERMRQLYKSEDAKRQSRQIQICSKAPPSTRKRSFSGGFGSGSSICNSTSNLMKKAKVEYLNCAEMRNRIAMKKITMQRSHSSSSMKMPALPHKESHAPQHKMPGVLQRKESATTSKFKRRECGKHPI